MSKILHSGVSIRNGAPGRGSGRYPLGSGKEPFQNIKNPNLIKRLIKKREKYLKDNKEPPQKLLTKEEYEESKQKVLKSGSAKDILRFKGDLTNQQMQDAIRRMDLERDLANYDSKFVKSKKEQMNDLMKDLRMITEWTKIGTEAYNSFAKIYNASKKGKEKPLTLVQGGEGSKKKKR